MQVDSHGYQIILTAYLQLQCSTNLDTQDTSVSVYKVHYVTFNFYSPYKEGIRIIPLRRLNSIVMLYINSCIFVQAWVTLNLKTDIQMYEQCQGYYNLVYSSSSE